MKPIKLFVLADSISLHYGPYLRDFLAPVFHYDRKGGNAAAGIPAIDLYGFTLPLGPEAYCDHVHFQNAVCRLQAAFIAGHLLSNRDRWLTPPSPAEARQQQSLQEQVK